MARRLDWDRARRLELVRDSAPVAAIRPSWRHQKATAGQMSYLRRLARQTGRRVPDHLNRAQASKLIDDLVRDLAA